MKTPKSSGILALAILALTGISCKEEVTKATVNATVTPNELQAPSASSYTLTLANKDANFETFRWTAPDFGFTSSTTYKLQMVKSDGNFTSPPPMEVGTTNSVLSLGITVGAMNDKLLGMGLPPQSPSSIKLRVVSTISDKVASVISTEKTISVTPYATVFPSIWGMGDGLNGWGPWPGASVEWASESFKKYETQAYLLNGKIFRFFEQQDWGPTSYNYNYFTTVDSDLILNPGDGDNNFKVAAATGWYTVTLDLVAKTVVVTPTTEPVLFITGAAQGAWGWNPGQYIKMKFIKPGVFEATPNFVNDTFRFFAQADWSPTSYNYPFFTTVDNAFSNANDGDKNFRYNGTPGAYKIRVNLTAKTVVH